MTAHFFCSISAPLFLLPGKRVLRVGSEFEKRKKGNGGKNSALEPDFFSALLCFFFFCGGVVRVSPPFLFFSFVKLRGGRDLIFFSAAAISPHHLAHTHRGFALLPLSRLKWGKFAHADYFFLHREKEKKEKRVQNGSFLSRLSRLLNAPTTGVRKFFVRERKRKSLCSFRVVYPRKHGA